MKLTKWFGVAALATAVVGLAACGASEKKADNTKDKTVTIKVGPLTTMSNNVGISLRRNLKKKM